MEKIEVGTVNNTHGLRGEIKVISLCDSPDYFEGFSKVWIGGRELTPLQVRYQKANLILALKEVTSIEQAESLKHKSVYALRSEVLDQMEEGRFLIADLIGLSVFEEERGLGKIEDVLQTGANDVLVVRTPNEKQLLLPLIDDVVETIEPEQGRVTVHLMEGLEEQ